MSDVRLALEELKEDVRSRPARGATLTRSPPARLRVAAGGPASLAASASVAWVMWNRTPASTGGADDHQAFHEQRGVRRQSGRVARWEDGCVCLERRRPRHLGHLRQVAGLLAAVETDQRARGENVARLVSRRPAHRLHISRWRRRSPGLRDSGAWRPPAPHHRRVGDRLVHRRPLVARHAPHDEPKAGGAFLVSLSDGSERRLTTFASGHMQDSAKFSADGDERAVHRGRVRRIVRAS